LAAPAVGIDHREIAALHELPLAAFFYFDEV